MTCTHIWVCPSVECRFSSGSNSSATGDKDKLIIYEKRCLQMTKPKLKFVLQALKHPAPPPAALAACLDVCTTREMCAAREQSSVARISEREYSCLPGSPWSWKKKNKCTCIHSSTNSRYTLTVYDRFFYADGNLHSVILVNVVRQFFAV